MVDQSTASLNANMAILIAAITDLTVAVHENIRICRVAVKTDTIAETSVPTTELSTLSLAPSPVLTPSKNGDSPDVIRQKLAVRTGSSQGTWYVVTVGQEPGLYHDIAEVSLLTSGVSGNAYKKYSSQEDALDAYERAWKLGAVKRVR